MEQAGGGQSRAEHAAQPVSMGSAGSAAVSSAFTVASESRLRPTAARSYGCAMARMKSRAMHCRGQE